MKNDFTKKLLISISIIFGTLITAAIALFYLTINLSVTAQAVAQSRQEIIQQATNFGNLDSLMQNAPKALKYQTAINQLFPTQDGLITFPPQVDSLSHKDGVSSDFSFQGDAVSSTESSVGDVGFTMNISGPIENIIAFLKDFEVSSPILLSSIDTFGLTGDGSNYTFTAKGRVFFQ